MSSPTSWTMRQVVVFAATFLVAWLLLHTLGTPVPGPGPATLALIAVLIALAIGLRSGGTRWQQVPAALGLSRPAAQGMALAGVVGGLYFTGLLLGANVLGVPLELRENWWAVLLGVLLFHGLAEELVWRGYVFARLRDHRRFSAAVWWSVPLIALTHIPIVVSDGWFVGALATLIAAITCWPLAHLWDRGGQTVWAPALLHALIDTWKLFELAHPLTFSLVATVASITVPLLVFSPALQKTSRHHWTSRSGRESTGNLHLEAVRRQGGPHDC